MNKKIYNVILLSTALFQSISIDAAEIPFDPLNGMQLAWVRLPSTPLGNQAADIPAPVPAAKPAPVPAAKPAPVPAAKPAPVPVAKPAPVPVAKPAPVPAAKPAPVPAAKPAPVHAAKPAPVHAAKPAPVHAAKPAPVSAANKSQMFEWVILLGTEIGGGELGQVHYTDGSSASVYANTGVVLNVGGVITHGKGSDFSTQLSLGYKYGGPRGGSSEVNWTALPLEIIEHYRIGSLRMGLGVSYQISPQLKVNLPASSFVDKYNNATGLIAQIGWFPLREHYTIDLRYVSIKFQQSDIPNASDVDGSVAGLYIGYRF